MTTQLSDADREAIEQQLKILLGNVMEMETFPAGQIAEMGIKLGWPSWIRVFSKKSDAAYSGPAKDVLLAVATSYGVLPSSGCYVFQQELYGQWIEALETAQQWFIMQGINPEVAQELYGTLTSPEAILDPSTKLDLKMIVHCGLKAGFPPTVKQSLNTGVKARLLQSMIEVADAVRLCHAYLLGFKVGDDMVMLSPDKWLIETGEWFPLFELIASWWQHYGPIMP